MPRQPRIQFEGAFYHVYHRGNRRERIFRDDLDYARFEQFLLEAMRWSGVLLYSWALMPNHFHLVVETPDGNLAEFMQRLLTRYARYFNDRYHLVGHLFQGRYGARVCDREAYFMELIRYVQLNPYKVRRRPLAPFGQWKWASHRFHIGREAPPEGTQVAFQQVLGKFGQTPRKACEGYSRFLSDGLASGSWEDFYKVKGDCFIGDDVFVERVKNQVDQPVRAAERRLRKLGHVNGLMTIVEALSGFSEEDFVRPSQKRAISRWRQAMAYVGRRHYRFAVKDLALKLGRHPTAVSQMLSQLWQNEDLLPEIETLLNSLETRAAAANLHLSSTSP